MLGRPTLYTPDLGEKILAKMTLGHSLQAAAASCGVHRQRIYEWAEKYPEFGEIVELARGMRVLKLETDLLAAPDGPTVTSRIFALKNASPDEWRDRVEKTVEMTVHNHEDALKALG